MKSPHLEAPPIEEVVCGVHFRPIARLDPIALGIFWKDGAAESFPKREFKVALTHQPSLEVHTSMDIGPIRTPAIRMEFRRIIQAAEEHHNAFLRANDQINSLFKKVLPESQLHRFANDWKPT